MRIRIPQSSFLLLLLLLLVCFFNNGVQAQNLINKTCKIAAKGDTNIKYDFCVTSLQAAPASQCAALRGLGMINIRLIRYNVTDTRCRIKQLLREKKAAQDPYVKGCLGDCLELYSDAIPNIKQVMRDYNAKKFFEANIKVSAIMDAATTCEDAFKEKKGVGSPLTKRNDDVVSLSAMLLSLMDMIQAGSAV
ncbi:PREDICTED: putative invertase inhibitor [Ipomoea nil]|uniref:putative invertase inhibitor n=1 Tax=Ipomoea nil TaxID=35883 RepID=UPI00090172BB|nr:PREDICTED: putative invertase inhibitor [Ipomoea nil]